MLKKLIVDNGIVYKLVGEIYYPLFNDANMSSGIYSNKIIESLIANGMLSKESAINKQLKYELFYLNCQCEQLCQKSLKEYLENHPNTPKYQLKYKYRDIQKEIINKCILQIKEEINNG